MVFILLLISVIVYLIISLVKKEFNPIKWFKKKGDDVIIQSIEFLSGVDKESVISNYTEKKFMIVNIEKKNTDIERVDITRKYDDKKQTIILDSNETKAVFELEDDITENQEIIIDYRIKDKPLQFLTTSEQVNLSTEQVETINNGEKIILEISNIKPDANILDVKTNNTLVDITLKNDPDVNLFGTSNVYFNPTSNKKKFYIIRDNVKQGVNSEGNLTDDKTSDDLFITINYGINTFISNENKTQILILDKGQLKMNNLYSMSTEELRKSSIRLKFRKKKYQ